MIYKKGVNYWLEQKQKNTKLWQRFKDAWDSGVFRQDIIKRFDMSEGTLGRVVKACKLKKRDGRPYSREVIEKKLDDGFKDRLVSLEGQIKTLKERNKSLYEAIDRQKMLWASEYKPPKTIRKFRDYSKYYLRLFFGDTHGCHINILARDAFLNDLDLFGNNVKEWVHGGDIRDCSSTYSRFKKIHLREFSYTIQDDTIAANDLLDKVQSKTPNAKGHLISGNHDDRVDFWAIEEFKNAADAKMVIDILGTKSVLHLEQRGINFYNSMDCHMGLNKPGMIQLGKCKIVHGSFNNIHATYQHLVECKDNIVHFHNHRNTQMVIRTPDKDAIIGCGVGCLCELQPYYFHYHLALHTHGYVLQIVNEKTEKFQNISIPIVKGKSMMSQFKDSVVKI